MVDSLAHDKHLVLDLKVARSLSAAVDMLDSGKVDLIAYDVPITEHYKKYVIPCGPENYTTQVLVQPKVHGQPVLTDVTQLVPKDFAEIEGGWIWVQVMLLNEFLNSRMEHEIIRIIKVNFLNCQLVGNHRI